MPWHNANGCKAGHRGAHPQGPRRSQAHWHLFTAIQRLWAKSRMPLVEAWEVQHLRPYLACAKGSGAMDVVWRQALRAEAGVESGQAAGAVLWDLKSFFDSIDHGLLLARARQLLTKEGVQQDGPCWSIAMAMVATWIWQPTFCEQSLPPES